MDRFYAQYKYHTHNILLDGPFWSDLDSATYNQLQKHINGNIILQSFEMTLAQHCAKFVYVFEYRIWLEC